jgi:hypothetical protein
MQRRMALMIGSLAAVYGGSVLLWGAPPKDGYSYRGRGATLAYGPVAQGPVAQGPVAQGPVAQGPVAQGPVAQGPVAQGPVAYGPVAPQAGVDGTSHRHAAPTTFPAAILSPSIIQEPPPSTASSLPTEASHAGAYWLPPAQPPIESIPPELWAQIPAACSANWIPSSSGSLVHEPTSNNPSWPQPHPASGRCEIFPAATATQPQPNASPYDPNAFPYESSAGPIALNAVPFDPNNVAQLATPTGPEGTATLAAPEYAVDPAIMMILAARQRRLENDIDQQRLLAGGDEALLPPAAPQASSDNLPSRSVQSDDETLLPAPSSDPLSLLGPTAAIKPADQNASGNGGDPLASMGPAQGGVRPLPSTEGTAPRDPHTDLFMEGMYPSAETCATCHKEHYEQWRASAHAYSFISPMFQKFDQAITDASTGTVGAFCVRCHAPVGVQLNMPREFSVLDAPKVVREGITCIACHRVREPYTRSNGHRRIEPGDVHQPVYGGIGGEGVAEVIARKDFYKVNTNPDEGGPGQPIHTQGIFFEPLTRSEFCTTCHQVAVHPGIWLEVVWAQYRAAPAADKGISCQDCHMGKVPGKAEGYDYGPQAEVAGKTIGPPRKRFNHLFYGPGYSIAHPGVFPHNPQANRWTPRQLLEFDWRSDWGTEAFERTVAQQPSAFLFPDAWREGDDRRDARRVIDENLRIANNKRLNATETYERSSSVTGPTFRDTPRVGEKLRFDYVVANTSDGHNLPTGSLGAQPQVWLNVALIGPQGNHLWESGFLDGNGDLADLHSQQVRQGLIKADQQLFNLQTKFLINNVKGTDREFFLPVNVDVDQIPFLRPGAVPVTVLNHPPLIRMEARSIGPLASQTASYRVPADRIREPGWYRLTARMRSRVQPTYFMNFCRATPEMVRRMNEQIIDFNVQSYTFEVR